MEWEEWLVEDFDTAREDSDIGWILFEALQLEEVF